VTDTRDGLAYTDAHAEKYRRTGFVLVEGKPVAVRVCIADTHWKSGVLVPATTVVHWVTGPVDYCTDCAAWMLNVAQAMGITCHTDTIVLPDALRAGAPDREVQL
jgi:hypothetical protein